MQMDLSQQKYTTRRSCRSNRVASSQGNRVTSGFLYIQACGWVCVRHTQTKSSIGKLMVTLATACRRMPKTLKIRGFMGNQVMVTSTK